MTKAPKSIATDVLRLECWLRTHPIEVGAGSIGMMAVTAALKVQGEAEWALAVSFVVPIWLCTYGVGLAAGVVMALGATGVWLQQVVSIEISSSGTISLFFVRLFTNLSVVALAALTSQAAKARERYLEREQDLARLRRDLVGAFSHDLRTPLSAIAGYSEILRFDGASLDPREVDDKLDRIITNARHLDVMIGDMLGVERGAESISVRATRFAPDALLADLQAEFDYASQSGRVAVHWDVEPSVREFETDRTKLTSIVRNLVNNAIKFTGRGDVWVRIRLDGGSCTHRIEIEDNGPGIPQEKLPNIFSRFYRANERESGFGLGLYIVKQFVEQIGGTAQVESCLGHGTTFVIRVPSLPFEGASETGASEERPV